MILALGSQHAGGGGREMVLPCASVAVAVQRKKKISFTREGFYRGILASHCGHTLTTMTLGDQRGRVCFSGPHNQAGLKARS